VGLRGIRIQNIVNELSGEKIDVVHWHADPAIFVANALSPAQVLSVDIDTTENTAKVVVPDRQLSLAIGKEGQNARLAAKLTGGRIDIKSLTIAKQEEEERAAQRAAQAAIEAEAAAIAAAAQEGLEAIAAAEAPGELAAAELPVGAAAELAPPAEALPAIDLDS